MSTRQRPSYRRHIQTQLGIAAVFFILGAGNLAYGNRKYNEYSELFSKTAAAQSERGARSQRNLPILLPEASVDQQSEHLQKIKSRMDFYSLVKLGGKIFLAVTGALLLLCVVTKKASGGPAS